MLADGARPGMGAGRMVMKHWLNGNLWRRFGYQPRHRSTRQSSAEADWLDVEMWDESLPEWDEQPDDDDEQPDDAVPEADESWPPGQEEPDLLEHLSSAQLRHLLEGCALDDMARIVRPLVQIIAHSSHSAVTLASAWGEFRTSTRDAYALHVGACRWSDFFRREELGSYPAEDAVERKLREADHAWQLLTNGAV